MHKIQSCLNKKTKIQNEISKNESKFTNADISKARILLNYKPKVTFNDGLKKFINWYLKYEKKTN